MARSKANHRVRDGRTRADEEGDAADSGRDVCGPGRNDGGAGAAVAPDGSLPGRRGGVPGRWGALDLGAFGVGDSAFGLAGPASVAGLGLVPRGPSSQLGAGTAPGRRGAQAGVQKTAEMAETRQLAEGGGGIAPPGGGSGADGRFLAVDGDRLSGPSWRGRASRVRDVSASRAAAGKRSDRERDSTGDQPAP